MTRDSKEDNLREILFFTTDLRHTDKQSGIFFSSFKPLFEKVQHLSQL